MRSTNPSGEQTSWAGQSWPFSAYRPVKGALAEDRFGSCDFLQGDGKDKGVVGLIRAPSEETKCSKG